MYQKQWRKIQSEALEDGVLLQDPAREADLVEFRDRCTEELGLVPPEGYIDFLKLADGLDWNGLVIYSTRTKLLKGYRDRFLEGFLSANLGYRESPQMEKRIAFGENGIDLFVQDISSRKFEIIDRISLDRATEARSFEEMLSLALDTVL